MLRTPSVGFPQYPTAGAWRLHYAPTQLRARDGNPPRDRFDDPEHEYRVRYLASSRLGSLLEVLDHFRPNDDTERRLSEITVDKDRIDIITEELAGAVPEIWLSRQKFALATVPDEALFADVTDPALLNELNDTPRVRGALHSELAAVSLGPAARLDQGTIRLVGPVGRAITQAVSREVYQDGRFAGISYLTRFDTAERCWAIFDDRVQVTFQAEEPLDILNSEHLQQLNAVAATYNLELPSNWTQD